MTDPKPLEAKRKATSDLMPNSKKQKVHVISLRLSLALSTDNLARPPRLPRQLQSNNMVVPPWQAYHSTQWQTSLSMQIRSQPYAWYVHEITNPLRCYVDLGSSYSKILSVKSCFVLPSSCFAKTYSRASHAQSYTRTSNRLLAYLPRQYDSMLSSTIPGASIVIRMATT